MTPVDSLSVVGSAVIAIDQAMEVDKAEGILVKQVAASVCVINYYFDEELISS